MTDFYPCCNDCGSSEHQWRTSFNCYLCDDCYTDALLEESRDNFDERERAND